MSSPSSEKHTPQYMPGPFGGLGLMITRQEIMDISWGLALLPRLLQLSHKT